MATLYDIGDQPTMRTVFSVDGTPTSPTTVAARYRKPDGTEGDLAATEESTGTWVATFPTLDAAGMWYGRMEGTAGVIAAEEVWFYVRQSRFTSP